MHRRGVGGEQAYRDRIIVAAGERWEHAALDVSLVERPDHLARSDDAFGDLETVAPCDGRRGFGVVQVVDVVAIVPL
jgi:hypothetical protein